MYANLVAHRAALIYVSIALSQTPAKAAKSTDTGLVCRVVCLFSSQLAPVPIYILLGEQWHMCVNNLPRVVHEAERAGLEPATYNGCRSDTVTTTPPLGRYFSLQYVTSSAY